MKVVSQFLKEVRQEVKKVTWPTKQETMRYSLMVIIASLIVAAYLGGVDYLVTKALDYFVFNK